MRSLPRRQRKQFAAATLWINEIYHLNQADETLPVGSQLGVRPSFPIVGQPGSSILGKDVTFERVLARSQPPGLNFETTVQWPRLQTLLKAGPTAALGVRTGKIGRTYISSLARFRTKQDVESWNILKYDFERYADVLCSSVGEKNPHPLIAKMSDYSSVGGAGAGVIATLLPDTTAAIVTAGSGFVWAVAGAAVKKLKPSVKATARFDPQTVVQIDAPARARRT